MERVALDDVAPTDSGADVDRRSLAGPLSTTAVAINHYRIAPGEGFPGGLHAHDDQEEMFVILAGTATFETYIPGPRCPAETDEPSSKFVAASDQAVSGREITVRDGEAVGFAPGEFQSGRNASDEPLVAIVIGAPRDSADVRIPLACPTCGDVDLGLDTSEERLFLRCPDCGAEHVPTACPACGGDDVRATLDASGTPVARCRDCDATFDEPPIRG